MRASQVDRPASVRAIPALPSILVQPAMTVVVMIMVVLGGCGVVPESPAVPPSRSVPATPAPIPASAEGPLTVDRVVDGDTVWVLRGDVRVKLRLIGIDTPETVDPRKPVQCFGREASEKAKRLLDSAEVYIESDPSQSAVDRYGRELVYLWRADGVFFNLEMIRSGYALEYTYDLPYDYQDAFRAAQRGAEDGQRGLWAPDTCSGDVERPAH